VAIVAEVEIDRRSGKLWARRFTVEHDCGLIINPDGLRRIKGNVVQGTIRALAEEVAFNRARVTSTDWLSYPILDITEAPEKVDIVLIIRPELPPAGAGESSIRPVAAAIANAVFDASGVRPQPRSASSRRSPEPLPDTVSCSGQCRRRLMSAARRASSTCLVHRLLNS
jgi:CO/xanthine dehydrogenase Mo-binding subunit